MIYRFNASFIRFFFWILVIWVFVLAMSPPSTVNPVMVFSDKLMHAGAFFVLGGLGFWAYPELRKIVFIGLLFYGGAIELAQSATADRSPEWMDWLADILGLALALPTYRLRHFFVK